MKGRGKKILSLSEHNSMMDMLIQLYGNDDEVKRVKDDTTNNNSYREPGAKSAGEMALVSPNTE